MVDDGQQVLGMCCCLLTDSLVKKMMINSGIFGPEGHPMSRPEATEAEATHRAIAMADQVAQREFMGKYEHKNIFKRLVYRSLSFM